MTEPETELVTYIQTRLEELTVVHEEAKKALNGIQGNDHLTKWKKKVVEGIVPFVSEEYVQQITLEWLETSYFVGNVFDELSDDVDMCRRHLKKLIKDVQVSGVP